MASIISRAFRYFNQRYLKKYVDNRYWRLADDDGGKVTTLMKEQLLSEIPRYYPHVNSEEMKAEKPLEYRFLLHIFERYLYRINDGIIEPGNHWVILGPGKVFRYSYQLIEDPWDYEKEKPSRIGYLMGKRRMRKVEKGILVKYNWTSYYHFFIDTLAQIQICDQMQLPDDIPLIVPHYYNQGDFVKAYLQHFPLRRQIIVQQKEEYLHVDELYVAKDVFCNDVYPAIRQNIIKSDIAASQPDTPSPERLFIKRKEGLRRSLSNAAVIEEIAAAAGFTVIDPGAYTWLQQVKLFSEARDIIGLHGAGLTNILFCRNNDVRLLELFPGNGYGPEHYKSMCIGLGYTYASLNGMGFDSNQQFAINPDECREKITSFFSPAAS